MQKVLYSYYAPVFVGLFFNKNQVCRQYPGFIVEVVSHTYKNTIHMLWRDTRHIPLFYVCCFCVNQT